MVSHLIKILLDVLRFPYLVVKLYQKQSEQEDRMHKLQLSLGRLHAKLNLMFPAEDIQNNEFQSFSQWGEDGIIQFITHRLQLPKDQQKFIEFGVQDFQESNCRFLMLKDNWSGLIIDGNRSFIERIKKNPEYWKFDLTAIERFITKENINQIFHENGFTGKIGLLSIDIDGNDYWVWEAIHAAQPAIVIVEWNSHFGATQDVSVPYDPAFDRMKKHHSGTYWGASITAFTRLANQKGYQLLGSNSTGINLFFVANEHSHKFKTVSATEAFVRGKFRDNRDSAGNLLFGNYEQRVQGIRGQPVWDFEKNKETTF